MANKADTAWDAFFDYFTRYDATPAEIADKFNRESQSPVVTAMQVRDWRRRHSRPQLTQLPELGHHWCGDPLFFARLLGAIPADGLNTELWLQRRLVELRGELRDVESTVRSADTTEATGRIVGAATASGKWAVAVQPAVEGPTGISVHVADRLDFRRVDRMTVVLSEDEEREQLESDLEHVFSRNQVVYAPWLDNMWDVGRRRPLRYAVAHTTASFTPARMWDHVGVRSIAIVSLTMGTWPIDVAALVARILGYGFVSTRALSKGHRPDGRIPSDDEAAISRTAVHQDLLHHPWHRYVWGHVGGVSLDPEVLFPSTFVPRLTTVWLRESPGLIDGLARGGAGGDRVRERKIAAELSSQQERAALASARNPNPIHEITCETADVGPEGLRIPRWDRTFRLAAEIVDHLLRSQSVQHTALARSVSGLRASKDPINEAVAEWLQQSGYAARWRTH